MSWDMPSDPMESRASFRAAQIVARECGSTARASRCTTSMLVLAKRWKWLAALLDILRCLCCYCCLGRFGFGAMDGGPERQASKLLLANGQHLLDAGMTGYRVRPSGCMVDAWLIASRRMPLR